MPWSDAIVRVCVQNKKGRWNIGTGFFVDKGLILTSAHVLDEKYDPSQLICIADYHGVKACENSDKEPSPSTNTPCGEGFIQAKLVWPLEQLSLDAALLRCDTGDETSLRLAAYEHSASLKLVSGGFPRGAKVDNKREYFDVSGTGAPRRRDSDVFSYSLATVANKATDWGGMSGAPVYDETSKTVVGMIVRAREAMQQSGFLEVVPAAHIAGAKGFAQHFGDWRSHRLPEDFRETFLAKVKDRLEIALSDLTPDESEELKDLFKTIVPDFSGNLSAHILFQYAEPIVSAIGRSQMKRRERNKDTALQFGLIGQLLCYDSISEEHLRLISYVGSKRNDETADPFSCLAHTLTLLEMLAAATDGLDPSLPAERDPARPPGSDWILPFAVMESGASAPTEVDSIAHLAKKTGVTLVSDEARDASLDSYFRREGLLYPEERDPATWDFISVADELSVRLEAARYRGARSYVLPAIRPADSVSAQTLRSSLQRLKSIVPDLLIMGLILDAQGARSEERELMPLLNTIPIKKKSRRRAIDD